MTSATMTPAPWTSIASAMQWLILLALGAFALKKKKPTLA
jgi:hypothetical protein